MRITILHYVGMVFLSACLSFSPVGYSAKKYRLSLIFLVCARLFFYLSGVVALPKRSRTPIESEADCPNGAFSS